MVIKQSLDINNLLAAITAGEEQKRTRTAASKKSCSRCGHTHADFQSSGRLGCEKDYAVFRKELEPLLKRIHDSLRHTGKTPIRASESVLRETEIQRLTSQLRRAVASEDFEAAAGIRDQLQQLREGPGADR